MMDRGDSRLSVSTILVLALTAVVPISVATGFSNFERPRQLVVVAMAALALIGWAVGLVRRGRVEIASPGTLVLGGAFLASVVGSLAWSGVVEFGAGSVVLWTSLGAVFLVLVAPVGRPPEFLDWGTAVGAGVLGAGGLGLYEMFGGGGLTPVWDPAGIAGGFDAMTFAAAYYVVAIPLLAGAVAVSKGMRRTFLAVALAAGIVHFGLVAGVVSVAVVVGAMVAVGLGIRLVGGGRFGRRGRWLAAVGALVVVVVAAGMTMMDRPDGAHSADDLPRVSSSGAFDTERAQNPHGSWWYFAADRMEANHDQQYRSYLNSVTRGLWQQEPIIGHGAGGWWLKQTDVVDVSDRQIRTMFDRYPAFKSPHSDFSRIAVEQGGLGVVLFALWLLGIATAIAGGIRGRDEEMDDEESVVTWSLATVFVAGVAAMALFPVLELVSSAVVWVGTAAMAVGHAARNQGGEGWLSVRSLGADRIWTRYTVAAVAGVVAVAMAVPAALQAKASLERGWADHKMLRSNFVEAQELYEEAHETYPAFAEVPYNIALSYKLQAHIAGGEEWIDEAVEMRPYDARFRAHAAHVSIETYRIRHGVEHGEEAIRVGPRYLEGYETYGAALQRRGRYSQAADLYESILDFEGMASDDRQVFRVQYATLLSSYLDRSEEALDQFRQAYDEMPAGSERELLADRIEELENRIERERLEAEGKPVPPELEEQDHDHDHDHGPMVPPGLEDHDH